MTPDVSVLLHACSIGLETVGCTDPMAGTACMMACSLRQDDYHTLQDMNAIALIEIWKHLHAFVKELEA